MDRYERLLELETFSKEKLALIQSKNVLVIGAGGVGQHISAYLITNGVTRITLVDFDKVEISNLNRQILLTEDDIGKNKVDVVRETLFKKNRDARVSLIRKKVDESNAKELVSGYDLVIDSVDNWDAKLAVSDACAELKIPFLHVGVDGSKGQYCLFVEKSLRDVVDDSIRSESRDGVLGPMVGLISSLASLLAIKFLTNDNPEVDTLYHFDSEKTHLGKMKL